MGFLEAYKSFWKNYFKFNGRSSRSAYWYTMIANSIIILVLYMLLIMIIVGNINNGMSVSAGPVIVMSIIYYGYILAAIIPNISLTVRRLHDCGLSGFIALLYLIPIIGSIILMIFACFKSDDANQYGEFSDNI
ncbi:DUF805 domain-containing protein [Listeria monocytogenes]|nr:DUF805 domain-containing protein [Listeria monocytogenes]